MSLVCATNFSDTAVRASTAAAELARRMGEPMQLVHVLNPDSARAFGRPFFEAAEGALAGEVKRLRALGATVEGQLLTGEPAAVLDAHAREQQASLVVTSGPSKEAPFLGVGGTVDRLAQTLSVPLLVVRDAAPFEAWVRGERPLRIMLGVDRSLPFEAARDWVRGLRRWGAVEVVGGRVAWADEEYQRLGLPRSPVFGELTPELRRALERETAALLAPLGESGAPPRFVLEEGLGRIADSLVALAEREKVDLLVVGAHHRRAFGRLWSVSFHALRLAPMSVACVPTQATTGAMDAALPEFQEVLVSTDFSVTGNRAVAYACGLSKPGGTVRLLHVADKAPSPEQEAALRQQLQALVPSTTESSGRRVVVEVLTGRDVAATVLQAAERFGVDAVVLGSRGRSGLKRAVLGSVTQQVMLHATRPVLVVNPPTGG
ncbi:universal stress protein [Corallococcus sp. H22C18031201]|nr:universal stress protein [Corallococcus sp. H22C18031201]